MEKHIGERLRVLLIDTENDCFSFITECVRKIIREPQIELFLCSNYDEAFTQLNQQWYDLYLINAFPDINPALDFARELMVKTDELPFIFLVNDNTAENGKIAIEAGAVDYLVKSELNPEKLGRTIRFGIERRRALRMLKANEKKYRSVFESSADSIFLIDKSFRFKNFNPATEELLECSKDQLKQRRLTDFLTNEYGAELLFSLEEKGRVDRIPIDLITANGVKKNCLFSASLQEDNEGDYYQVIIHDITEMKKAEKIILRREKRTALDRMLEALAHEVRNPLNNITLAIEQLTPDLSEEENKVLIDIISRNSKRIDNLITQLLNSSRPAEIIGKEVSLQDVIKGAVANAHDRITLKKIQYFENLPSEIVWIKADKVKLQIALQNIIINAIEAMGEGVGVLTISLSVMNENGVLDIDDNGCGISKDRLEHIFDPYFTGKRKGLGLGLSTTLNIIQSHNANIDVESAPGEGTRFRLSFPLYYR